MALKLLVIGSIALCLFSLAARSYAMRAAAAQKPPVPTMLREEKLALAGIDGRLHTKLRKLARR